MSEVLAVAEAEEQRIYVGGVFRLGPGDKSAAAEVTPLKCSQGLPLWVVSNTGGSIPESESGSDNSAEPFVPDFLLYRDTTPAEAARLAEVSQASIVRKPPRRSLFQIAVAGIEPNCYASGIARETTASAQYPEVGIAGLYSGGSEFAYGSARMVESLGAQAHSEGIGLGKYTKALKGLLYPKPQALSDANESTHMVETGVSRSATVRVVEEASRRAIALAVSGGGYNIFHLSTTDDVSWQVGSLGRADEGDGFREIGLDEVRIGDRIVITSASSISAKDVLSGIGGNQEFANSIANGYEHPTMVISVN